MPNFSFNHLDSVEFENFCFDLLSEIGFINLNWRKGTGFKSSPSDKGRDLQGNIIKEEIDGNKYLEKWFFECKHYKKGIPATELSNAINWASAERPDVLLIIASNFFSNSAKDYIDTYIRENKPSFKIKCWERTDLEKLVIKYNNIIIRYKLSPLLGQLHNISPIHLLYITNLSFNSLNFLFSLIDKIDIKIRDEILGHTFTYIINPRLRKPVTMKETMRELLMDDISYESFKKNCLEIIKIIPEDLLINSIITYTLQYLYLMSDKTKIEEIRNNHRFLINSLKDEILMKKTSEEKKEVQEMISDSEKMIKEIPEIMDNRYKNYIYFCENIVSELFKEKLIFEKLKDFRNTFRT